MIAQGNALGSTAVSVEALKARKVDGLTRLESPFASALEQPNPSIRHSHFGNSNPFSSTGTFVLISLNLRVHPIHGSTYDWRITNGILTPSTSL